MWRSEVDIKSPLNEGKESKRKGKDMAPPGYGGGESLLQICGRAQPEAETSRVVMTLNHGEKERGARSSTSRPKVKRTVQRRVGSLNDWII